MDVNSTDCLPTTSTSPHGLPRNILTYNSSEWAQQLSRQAMKHSGKAGKSTARTENGLAFEDWLQNVTYLGGKGLSLEEIQVRCDFRRRLTRREAAQVESEMERGRLLGIAAIKEAMFDVAQKGGVTAQREVLGSLGAFDDELEGQEEMREEVPEEAPRIIVERTVIHPEDHNS